MRSAAAAAAVAAVGPEMQSVSAVIAHTAAFSFFLFLILDSKLPPICQPERWRVFFLPRFAAMRLFEAPPPPPCSSSSFILFFFSYFATGVLSSSALSASEPLLFADERRSPPPTKPDGGRWRPMAEARTRGLDEAQWLAGGQSSGGLDGFYRRALSWIWTF